MIGCIALTERAHQIILATQTGLHLFDWHTLRSYPLCGFPSDSSIFRFNDGLVSTAGSLLVGSLLLDEDHGHDRGSMYEYAWDSNEQIMRYATLWNGCHIPNGMAIDTQRKRLYFIDTPLQRIDVFDYDETKSIAASLSSAALAAAPSTVTAAASSTSAVASAAAASSVDSTTMPIGVYHGLLSNRRIAFSIPSTHGHPDGMCMDSSDRLWIAHWAGSRVTCWSTSGELQFIAHLPTPKTTAPCFGGDTQLTQLFVTTASRDSNLQTDPLAGSLLQVELKQQQQQPQARGREPTRFKGDIKIEGRTYRQHSLFKAKKEGAI